MLPKNYLQIRMEEALREKEHGIEVVIERIKVGHVKAWKNPNWKKDGIDIKTNGRGSYKVEVRSPWTTTKYPFKDIRIQSRKTKHIKTNNLKYVFVNGVFRTAAIVKSENIEKVPDKKLKFNKYDGYEENFKVIGIDKINEFWDLTEKRKR
jgi:hypothetical protein